jgi:hypothetical protein
VLIFPLVMRMAIREIFAFPSENDRQKRWHNRCFSRGA